MPIYEYKCTACGRVEERTYPIDNFPVITVCGKCGGISDKIMSRHSFNSYELEFERTGRIDGQNKFHRS